ncbi:MAG: hypothetical protein JNN08_09115 [Bryobacterales bacterium]|nr:hypothetical protein [Bryobacterales bacterium]
MMYPRVLRGAFVAVFLLPATACWFRKPKASTPPPIITSVPTETPKPPPTIPSPPRIEQQTGQIPTLPQGAESAPVQPPKPPAKPVRTVRRPSTPKPVPSAQSSEAPPETAPAPSPEEPVLQLAPLLTAEQQTAYNTAIDAALQRAEANLARLDPRRLKGSQRSNFQRVRLFIQQAQQTRTSDLAVAKSLADRADLLAQDLARNFR